MLKKENHDKIESIFFDNPSKAFKLREICRIADLGPKSMYVYLNHFINRTVVRIKEEYGLKLYQANTESEIYKIDKTRYNIDKVRRSGIIDEINKKFDYPTIILFGSKAKGEDIEKSDFDIAIISPIKENIKLEKYEKKLNSEIQLFLIPDFSKESKELKNNIINGKLLSGYLEVFK